MVYETKLNETNYYLSSILRRLAISIGFFYLHRSWIHWIYVMFVFILEGLIGTFVLFDHTMVLMVNLGALRPLDYSYPSASCHIYIVSII